MDREPLASLNRYRHDFSQGSRHIFCFKTVRFVATQTGIQIAKVNSSSKFIPSPTHGERGMGGMP